VIAGFEPSPTFPDQFIGRLYAYFAPFAPRTFGETLCQTPSFGHGRFSRSGDVGVDVQLLDAIPYECFST
jgi:hypothetical protein